MINLFRINDLRDKCNESMDKRFEKRTGMEKSLDSVNNIRLDN